MKKKQKGLKPSKKAIRESVSMGMLAFPGLILLLIFTIILLLYRPATLFYQPDKSTYLHIVNYT